MNNKHTIILSVLLFFVVSTHADKALWHYVSLPLIEGAGAYASIASLTDDNSGASTKAASITNLSLLGTNATLGLISMFSSEETAYKLRTTHRIIGIAVSAAALWLSVSSSVDDVKQTPRIFSYAYTGMSVVPIIMFSF